MTHDPLTIRQHLRTLRGKIAVIVAVALIGIGLALFATRNDDERHSDQPVRPLPISTSLTPSPEHAPPSLRP